MSNSGPVVSIGMPVYNGERYTRQALDSLLAQDFQNYELIISDNASTDSTPAICQAYAARERRIRYSRAEDHQSALSNFDRVLQMATGEYFMWAAADDLWEPAFISTLCGLLAETPRAALAFSAFNNVNEQGEEIRAYRRLSELPSSDRLQRLRNFMVHDESLGKANLIYGLIRRSAIQVAGGFRGWSKPVWGIDMLVVFRLLSLGDLVLTEELLFHKRLVADPSGPGTTGRTPVVGMASQYWRAIEDWYGYVSGYARLIDIDDSLTAREKMQLRAVLLGKSVRFGATSLRRRLFT